MFLKSISLRNFRLFNTGEFEVQKDLTIFGDEHNGGKSHAIDAIRLMPLPLGGREISCEPKYSRFQSLIKGFEMEVVYMALLNDFFGDTSVENLARELDRQVKCTVLTKLDEAVVKGLMALPARADHPANLPEVQALYTALRPERRQTKRYLSQPRNMRRHYNGQSDPVDAAGGRVKQKVSVIC